MARQVATQRSNAGRLPAMCAPGFVGRQRERAAMERSLAAAPAIVLIEGEAGIGKTRLVQEVLASPAGRAHSALVATCPPFLRPCTLGPVVDAVRQAAPGVRGLGLSGLAGALRPLFPEWAAELPPAPEPAEDAAAARHRLFRALAELLACLRVGLLAVEDAHWADEATLEFLLLLASHRPQPVSMVVTYRPEDVPDGSLVPRLSRLAAGGAGLRLSLGPLDVTETAGLVSSMLAGQEVTTEFAAFVHQHTDGVPLAVEESVRLMGDRSDLTRHEGAWVRRPLAEIEVPHSIRDAVLERVGRLGSDAQAVVRAAAVLSDPGNEATVASVTGLGADRTRAGVAEALGCGLLGEDRHGLVSFRHMLAGRAVYDAIPGPHRRVWHLRAGRALEGVSPLPVLQLARHFREAGDTERWSRYSEQGADTALASGDPASAAVLLLDLITGAGPPARELARLTSKVPAATLNGSALHRQLVRALRAALNTMTLDAEEEAALRLHLGRVLMGSIEFDAAPAELEQAIPHLKHDPIQAAGAMVLLGWPRRNNVPASVHRRWLKRADEITRPIPMAPVARLRFAVDMATVLLNLGEEEGWVAAADIPDDARTGQEWPQVTRGQLNTGEMAIVWGRYEEARRRLARAMDLDESHPYPLYRDLILLSLARLDWFTGAWHGLAERTASLADKEDLLPARRLEAVLVAGLLHAARGEAPEAETDLQLVLGEEQRRGALDNSMEPAGALARLRLADSRVDDALQVTDEPIDILTQKGIWLWATEVGPARVAALSAAGRLAEATELVTAFGRGLRGRNAPAPMAALVLCRAILAEARREHARAAVLFGRAASAWAALPRPYDALLAREGQARCLLAGAQPEAGLALLHQVFDDLSKLGARGDAVRVMRILGQHGIEVRRTWRGRPGYGYRLSPRETEVARLLVDGRTNRQIAEALFLSPKTVGAHVERLMRKLGVSSRTAVAVRVAEAGIVPGDGLAAGAE